MFTHLNFGNPVSVRLRLKAAFHDHYDRCDRYDREWFPFELLSLNFFISDRSDHMESGLTYSQDRKSCNQDIMISCCNLFTVWFNRIRITLGFAADSTVFLSPAIGDALPHCSILLAFLPYVLTYQALKFKVIEKIK